MVSVQNVSITGSLVQVQYDDGQVVNVSLPPKVFRGIVKGANGGSASLIVLENSLDVNLSLARLGDSWYNLIASADVFTPDKTWVSMTGFPNFNAPPTVVVPNAHTVNFGFFASTSDNAIFNIEVLVYP